jgi:hypothetical protein
MAAVLLILAVILFVLRAFGVHSGGSFDFGWIGLACFAASFLVGSIPFTFQRAG